MRVFAGTRAKIQQLREDFPVTHEVEMVTRQPTITCTSRTALSCLQGCFPACLWSLVKAILDGFQSLQDQPRVHELPSC